MSDKPVNGNPPQQSAQAVNQQQAGYNAIAQAANLMLALGMPTNAVIDVIFDVGCNLVAGIEPAPLRQTIVEAIRNNFPGIVERHYTLRHTTESGLFVPPGAG